MQMALSIKPSFSQSLNNIGVVYTVQVGSWLTIQHLVYTVRMLHSLVNKLRVTYNQFVLWIQGKMDDAASMIEKAIMENPAYAEAYNNLGDYTEFSDL